MVGWANILKKRMIIMPWEKFNPVREEYGSDEEYQAYLDKCRCAICHERLNHGEEFDMRPVHTYEGVDRSIVAVAVIIHKKCVM